MLIADPCVGVCDVLVNKFKTTEVNLGILRSGPMRSATICGSPHDSHRPTVHGELGRFNSLFLFVKVFLWVGWVTDMFT